MEWMTSVRMWAYTTMRQPLAGALLASAVACGCSDGEAWSDTTGARLTYYRDAKPIIDGKCTTCHVEGGIAPFALTDHESILPYTDMLKTSVAERTMPPWSPAAGCTDYLGDRSLSEEQIATLIDWVDDGAIEGDPAMEALPVDLGPPSTLSRADVTLSMRADYTPTIEPDDYRCFVLDWPLARTTYVTGFRANPGNLRVAHHLVAYLIAPAHAHAVQAKDAADAGPGYTCFSGPGGQPVGLGSYAPGVEGSDFPSGVGVKVLPGSKIVLEMHYNTLATGPEPDRSSVDFKVDSTVEKEGHITPWLNPAWLQPGGMHIPAGASDVMHAWEGDPGDGGPLQQPMTLHSASVHMHARGTRGLVRIHRADGTNECMLDIPRYDFHWQGIYRFTTPKTLQPGDKLYLECHWDNTQANQPWIRGAHLPPHDLAWGQATTDEMCLAGFFWTT